MKFDKKDLFTIPNILTYIRIICVPFFIWLMLDSRIPNNIYYAFGVFLFASVTDVVDGFIARHFNMVSDIGKVTDPLADKMLQVSTLFCLTLIGKIHWAFPLVFCIKEAYMVLGGGVIIKIFKSEYVIQSNFFGKGATVLNTFGIVMAFFVNEVNDAYDFAVVVILTCGAVFAVVTAGIYTYKFFKFRKKEVENAKEHDVEALKEYLSDDCGKLEVKEVEDIFVGDSFEDRVKKEQNLEEQQEIKGEN